MAKRYWFKRYRPDPSVPSFMVAPTDGKSWAGFLLFVFGGAFLLLGTLSGRLPPKWFFAYFALTFVVGSFVLAYKTDFED